MLNLFSMSSFVQFVGAFNFANVYKIFGLEYTFKPFEKVLIAVALSSGKFFWKLDFFSHKMGDHYVCMGMASHKCLPYEGNEHLLGMDVE